jgi:hypothetical protein
MVVVVVVVVVTVADNRGRPVYLLSCTCCYLH